jgi:hypothetical protein
VYAASGASQISGGIDVPRAKDLPVWISTGRLALLLGLHPKTIKKCIREGLIPSDLIRRLPSRRGYGDLRFDRERVLEILDPHDPTNASR